MIEPFVFVALLIGLAVAVGIIIRMGETRASERKLKAANENDERRLAATTDPAKREKLQRRINERNRGQ